MQVKFHYIGSLEIRDELALNIPDIGDVTYEIMELIDVPEIKEQLHKFDPKDVRLELLNCEIDLEDYHYEDHEENLILLVHEAVLQVKEYLHLKKDEN